MDKEDKTDLLTACLLSHIISIPTSIGIGIGIDDT